MSIFLPPEGESLALPVMAAARKSSKKTTSRPPRKSAKKKRAPRKQAAAKNGKVKRVISVISHIKQPDHARGSYGANSAINLYLNEIAQYSLITVQDEIDLAARIKKGDEEAEQELINANLRLVVKIARPMAAIASMGTRAAAGW